jgi:periplasmic protein TonB
MPVAFHQTNRTPAAALLGSIGLHALLGVLFLNFFVTARPVSVGTEPRLLLSLGTLTAPVSQNEATITDPQLLPTPDAAPRHAPQPKPHETSPTEAAHPEPLPVRPAPAADPLPATSRQAAPPATVSPAETSNTDALTSPAASSAPSVSMDVPANLPDPNTGAAVLKQIRDLIVRSVTYPATARRLGLEGTVTVSFVLRTDGTLQQAAVTSSSGTRLLDRRALETVRGLSGRFPPVEHRVELSVPIAFKLHQA